MDFYQNLAAYTQCFSDVNGEYWFGLEVTLVACLGKEGGDDLQANPLMAFSIKDGDHSNI